MINHFNSNIMVSSYRHLNYKLIQKYTCTNEKFLCFILIQHLYFEKYAIIQKFHATLQQIYTIINKSIAFAISVSLRF